MGSVFRFVLFFADQAEFFDLWRQEE